MCSFLIYKNNKFNGKIINKCIEKLKLRGPDLTNIFKLNDYIFIHNLLHICGEKTIQPFVENNIVCLFNGEIYNYKSFGDYKSDGECIIKLYNNYGMEFVKYLDGEFAIVIFDFDKKCIILSSDIFATKPLFYSINNEDKSILISSLPSTFDMTKTVKIKSKPNECIKLDLENFKLINTTSVYNFDLNQHKTNFDDWNKAFENAVLKRVDINFKIGLCLSSGYDSGSIACVLEKYNKAFESYTITASENLEILNKRKNINNLHINHSFSLKENEYNLNKKMYEKNIENITVKLPNGNYELKSDWAGVGLHYIYNISKKNNTFVFLSGTGGDEIFSDYGFQGKNIKKYKRNKIPINAGTIMGLFTSNLSDIFPWVNFYNGSMEAFIAKEEYTGSLFGIETRYPFLDKYVVQEFLWLSVELKNKNYKSPLYNYMIIHNYPFKENEKIGFKAKANLINESTNK